MRTLLILKDIDIINEASDEKIKYEPRIASRTVLFNKGGKIALLFVSKKNYHKLPGGGIEKNEDLKLALKREIKEEVGCDSKVIAEIGKIIEYRDKENRKQISYCYTTEVMGSIENPQFTEKEKSLGFELKWVNIEEALELIRKDNPLSYSGKFIVKRDGEFIEIAKELLLMNKS